MNKNKDYMKKIIMKNILTVLKGKEKYKLKNMDGNQEIISRLKFIGQIKKGEKINTKHMYVQPDGFGTSLSRTFFKQDNRGNALSFCNETIIRSFELLITYERSSSKSERILFQNLLLDLDQATTGLSNLKVTYIVDTKFCCDMDTILQNTRAKLDKYTSTDCEIENDIEL